MQNQTVNDWYILIILRLEQLSFPNSINEAVTRACRRNWIASSGSHFTQTLSTILFLDGLKRKRNQ